jgi:hypothetical protein
MAGVAVGVGFVIALGAIWVGRALAKRKLDQINRDRPPSS